MSWIIFKDERDFRPKHKDLVLCWDGEVILPAIYYYNNSFNGFYFYTTFYENQGHKTIYSKVKLKPKHKIENVIKWKLLDKP